MSKSILVIAASIVALSGMTATADPLGGITGVASLGHRLSTPSEMADCDRLRRDPELRMRVRPSERRERIRNCELAVLEFMIADNGKASNPGAADPAPQ